MICVEIRMRCLACKLVAQGREMPTEDLREVEKEENWKGEKRRGGVVWQMLFIRVGGCRSDLVWPL
jgi:hypothetical protein